MLEPIASILLLSICLTFRVDHSVDVGSLRSWNSRVAAVLVRPLIFGSFRLKLHYGFSVDNTPLFEEVMVTVICTVLNQDVHVVFPEAFAHPR
uniref:Secreted protein n=1 Tax=Rhipicephalus appendiculatus TaxID=34631 RepID=A0A131YAS3_RHIAP